MCVRACVSVCVCVCVCVAQARQDGLEAERRRKAEETAKLRAMQVAYIYDILSLYTAPQGGGDGQAARHAGCE